MSLHTLNDQEISELLTRGEFSERVRASADHVVIIMTQDWCPQWLDMEAYLPEFANSLDVYTLSYNKHKRFAEIMSFKENTFGNREVPYVRAYYKGSFLGSTNWLPKRTFASLIQKTSPFKL